MYIKNVYRPILVSLCFSSLLNAGSIARMQSKGSLMNLQLDKTVNPKGDFSEINLSGMNLTDLDGFTKLLTAQEAAKVVKLKLNGNAISSIHRVDAKTGKEMFQGFPVLRELHLENNNISEIEDGVFAPLNRNENRVTVFLLDNPYLRSGTALRLKKDYPLITFKFPTDIERLLTR